MNRITAILSAFFLLLVLSCEKQDSKKISQVSTEIPDQVIENSTIVFTVDGVKSTVVRADYIAKYEKKDYALAKVLNIDFYDKEGRHTSNLTAREGKIRERKQQLEVEGDVIVLTDQGVKLETQTLKWDPQKNKIVTDDFVKITRQKDVITGYGLETDQELKNFKIKRNVKGELRELKNTPETIE